MEIAGRRVMIVTAGFATVLVAIGDLAWATGVSASGPWFSPGISLQVYLGTLVASTLLLIGLAIVASIHVASIGRSVAELDQRIAVLRGRARTLEPLANVGVSDPSPDVEDEIDEILGVKERTVTSALFEVKPISADRVVSIPVASGDRELRSVVRELVSERINIRKGISYVRWAVGGPIAAAIFFGAIASAMLPATEGFGVANFQLNTTLILFLAYGWPFLVGWAAAAIALARHLEPL